MKNTTVVVKQEIIWGATEGVRNRKRDGCKWREREKER